ncbi:MAG: hypothetical protein ACRD33_10740, partial [Candidatus Acidiferrales bacterium]
LNTGGQNYDETQYVVAHNAIHHSAEYPSKITITVVPNPHPWVFAKGNILQRESSGTSGRN